MKLFPNKGLQHVLIKKRLLIRGGSEDSPPAERVVSKRANKPIRQLLPLKKII
jgi:hypothetical protein